MLLNYQIADGAMPSGAGEVMVSEGTLSAVAYSWSCHNCRISSHEEPSNATIVEAWDEMGRHDVA